MLPIDGSQNRMRYGDSVFGGRGGLTPQGNQGSEGVKDFRGFKFGLYRVYGVNEGVGAVCSSAHVGGGGVGFPAVKFYGVYPCSVSQQERKMEDDSDFPKLQLPQNPKFHHSGVLGAYGPPPPRPSG